MESCRHVINDAAARDYQNMMTTVMSSTGSQPVSSLQGLQRGGVIRLTHQHGGNWHCCSICPPTNQNELKLIPYLYHRKKWTGWDLNPRPQPAFLSQLCALSKEAAAIEIELYCSSTPTRSTICSLSKQVNC
jgi:hypothetical protein